VGSAAGEAFPVLPEVITDRKAEAWEPLIAIADAAGGTWSERARVASVADVAATRERVPTLGIRLLSDIREAFKEKDVLATSDLLEILNNMDEAPWGDLRGKTLDSRGLAMRLKKYGVAPKTVRIETATPKGYTRENLYDAWERYLPSPPITSATSATSATLRL